MQIDSYLTHVATITTAQRAPSPCPCKSKECTDQHKADQEAYQRLLTAKAKGEHLLRQPTAK